jgi:uncharacterized protein with NRDE domain
MDFYTMINKVFPTMTYNVMGGDIVYKVYYENVMGSYRNGQKGISVIVKFERDSPLNIITISQKVLLSHLRSEIAKKQKYLGITSVIVMLDKSENSDQCI